MQEQPFTGMGGGEITDDDKLWSLLSWLTFVVGLIVLFMEDKKSRPFVKYNAVMALVVGGILIILVGVTAPFTCGITALAWIYPVILGIQAFKGTWVKVPVITDFVKKQGWASSPDM